MSGSSSSENAIKLFLVPPHSCSYLPDLSTSSLLVDPDYPMTMGLYGFLSNSGFRRSSHYIYRPFCKDCNACLSIRLPVDSFSMSRAQRRNWRLNQDLRVRVVPAEDTDRHYELYSRYISARHVEGDMYPPDRKQFRTFLACDWSDTVFHEFWSEDELLSVLIVDRLPQGCSAVYCFFEPSETHRGLGSYAVLHLIEMARNRNLPLVYLGYWIRNCRKMSYKVRYRPFELLEGGHWVRYEELAPF